MDRLTTGGAPWWYGGLFIAIGAFIMLIAAGVVPMDPDSVSAPPWVLALAGGVFAIGGAKSMTTQKDGWVRQMLALLMVAALGAMSVWAAFGPTDPDFGIGTSVGPVAVSTPGPSWMARVMFGAAAIVLFGAFVSLVHRYFKRLSRASSNGAQKEQGSE